jgi:hypothetical protein
MKAIPLHDIKKIVTLLDKGFLVFIHLDTGSVTGIPEFDDYVDFFDDEAQFFYNEIESHPEEYFQIQPPTSRELFNMMMDFAQEQEQPQITNELVRALRESNAIDRFRSKLNQLEPQIKNNWMQYKQENMVQYVRRKLIRKRKVCRQ